MTDDALRAQIAAHLNAFEPVFHEQDGNLREAAVAITIVNTAQNPAIHHIEYDDGMAQQGAIILTKRNARMREHANQWALPGGRMDAGETPEQTALRELEEEVGLSLGEEAVIGRLDDFTTRSGYIMKPVVIWGGCDVDLNPNPSEVASAHRIPFAELLRSDSPFFWREDPDSEHPILLMRIGSTWIAAPTAAIVYQFREVGILGNAVRVAHYEQPRFAWK